MTKTHHILLILTIIPIMLWHCVPKIAVETLKEEKPIVQRGDYRMMFYNCENFFDCEDDSLKNDDEFTQTGMKHWTPDKMYTKAKNIAKVITAIGQWQLPEVVGLCEVENRFVLEKLLNNTPLRNTDYRIIHKESPDNRGIDVALLYRKSRFFPISYEAIQIRFPESPSRKTRDLLYVKGETKNNDTLHIFINHWPSRWGGQLESETGRLYVASVVRLHVDSIFNTSQNAKILIMGDLNDYPDNESVSKILEANMQFDTIIGNQLYNLAYKNNLKTHKHESAWGCLDQIIISGNLLLDKKQLHTNDNDAHAYDADFLLEVDEANIGFRNFRTYIGYKYNGGYSDHLPVYMDLWTGTNESDIESIK